MIYLGFAPKVLYLIEIIFCVAAKLAELDEEIGSTIMAAWSRNTLSTRNSQWKMYLNFCHEFGLQGLPASDLTIARFLLFKAKSVKYVTLNNYLSAIISLHKFYGFDQKFREKYFIKLVMEGLKSRLGQQVSQKQPLSTDQLLQMYNHVNKSNTKEMIMWSAIVISFRSLLRKSNLLPDKIDDACDHLMLRRDVVATDYGFCLNVYSTKTLKYRERVLRIPVVSTQGSPLCGVSALRYAFDHGSTNSSDPLFMYNNVPVLYGEVLKYLKLLVSRIGLDPKETGLHSLRRSGAQFLQSIGVPLSEIMFMGDWSSLAVLSYLVTTFDKKIEIEKQASKVLQM